MLKWLRTKYQTQKTIRLKNGKLSFFPREKPVGIVGVTYKRGLGSYVEFIPGHIMIELEITA
jgi:hypothetical protein